jgi:general secretion pathway protein D
MKNLQTSGVKFLIVFAMLLGFTQNLTANSCSTKLFSVTIDSKLTIGDVIDNLAETCGLTVIVKDDAAKLRMNKKLYYVKLKNSTLNGFLNTILKDNDLNYTLSDNKLKISYLITKTFRIHYISGDRIGKSTANVTIAGTEDSAGSGGGAGGEGSSSKTGIEIESTDDFQFWKTVEEEVQRILIGAADGSTHYTRSGDTWTGPEGKVWEYNPLAPIVNAEAGMVTVTGTERQINRVGRYIHALTKQIKSQVLIDIRILSVEFDDSRQTGVDWNQLYSLQNLTVNSLLMAQNNVVEYTFDAVDGITQYTYGDVGQKKNAQLVSMTGNTDITEVVKLTLNNQPALISVGQELFYKIKSSSTASSTGGAVAAEGELVDSVFAGILLDITPEIAENGMITLKINPSISETADTVTAESGVRTIPPDLKRRQISSVIKVKDGHHAILGGLISSQSGFKDNHIPVLGDIPGLGSLFKSQQTINKAEELVFIISPHVVKSSKSVSLKDLGYSKIDEK